MGINDHAVIKKDAAEWDRPPAANPRTFIRSVRIDSERKNPATAIRLEIKTVPEDAVVEAGPPAAAAPDGVAVADVPAR